MTADATAMAGGLRVADRLDARAMLILVACCACWGVNQVAIKVANTGISPLLQIGLRSLLAAALVFAWSQARGVPLFRRDSTFWPGIISGLMFAGEFLALYVGLSYTSASRGVVFLYLAPFVIAFGAHFLIPGDRLNAFKALGLLAALGGLVVAMGEGVFSASGRATLTGDLLCVVAAVMWAATTLLVRVTPLRSVAPEKTLLYQLAVSGIVLVPASHLAGEPGFFEVSWPVVLAFSYTVLVVASVSYLAWFWLVRHYPPTRLSAFTFLSPVFGVMAGNLMLAEPFTPTLAAALALVAFGIFLVNRPAGNGLGRRQGNAAP
jgi:drug/metabolite transporter (DMT)-like permease